MKCQAIAGLPREVLKGWGSLVGHRPILVGSVSFIILACFSLGWLHVGKNGEHAMTDLKFEQQWTVQGSAMYEQISYVIGHWKDKNKARWGEDYHYMMVLGKGAYEGADLLTPEMLDEVAKLYGQFFEINVKTKSGKVYDTRDLCSRGIIPDAEENPVKLPCKIVDVLQCFQEYAQFLDPYYAANVDVEPTASQNGLLSFSNSTKRPSWKTLSPAEIKARASKGCPWYSEDFMWKVPMFAGAREPAGVWKDGDLLKKVDALSFTIYMDAPQRIKFRLSLNKPDLADASEIEEALSLHGKAWASVIQKFSQESSILEAAVLKTNWLEDLELELEAPRWHLMIAGGVLLTLFVNLSMASWTKPSESRAGLGGLGLAIVLAATISAGGLFFLLGYKLNSAIMGGILFLAMGLGVNDMLVLTRSFSLLGEAFIKENTNSVIVREVMAQAGLGVTLTSFSNVSAFLIAGALLPIHGLSHFCVAVAVDSATNYFAMMTLFLVALCMEARRIRKGAPDLSFVTLCCHMRMLRQCPDAESSSSASLIEDKFVSILEKKVAPLFAKLPVGVGFALLSSLTLGLAVVPIVNKTFGYNPEEIAPTTDFSHRALELIFDSFNFFEAWLFFRDIDVPSNQVDMLTLFTDITNTTETKFTVGTWPPYLSTFYSVAPFVAYAAGVNSSLVFDVQTMKEGPAKELWAPSGIINKEVFYDLWSPYQKVPFDNPMDQSVFQLYQYADLLFANEFEYDEDGAILTSHMPFYLTNMDPQNTDANFLTCMERTNKILKDSPLRNQAFVYSDIYVYWSAFVEIDAMLWRALGILLLVIFTQCVILLQSPTSATIAAVMSTMIVCHAFGMCMTFLKFNTFVVMSLLAGAGISLEFTAHVASNFVLSTGSPEKRLADMMKETYPAIILGSVSTLLGLVPLAFSPVPFIIRYIFWPFVIVVMVGMFDGLILLPGLLALCANLRGSRGQQEIQVEIPSHTEGAPVILGSNATQKGAADGKAEVTV